MTADEAKAIVDRFAAADSSMAAIAAVAKQLFDQVAADAQELSAADRCELEKWRAKAEVNRAQTKVRVRELRMREKRERNANACQTSSNANVCQTGPDASRTRARSSSSYLEESKKEGGGGVCAREGARDTHENKMILKVVSQQDDPEEVAPEAAQIVKASSHWPTRDTEGWIHSTVVGQVAQLLRAGVSRNEILGAVRMAAEGHPLGNPIGTFAFFLKAIMRAHAAATAQLALPLNNFKSVTGGKNDQRRSSSEQRFASRHEARAADRPASGGIDIEVGVPVDATETG